MELKWLEDYLALVKYRNFSEAAKARHLTQPAFSRRIRLLEAWMDVVLINRGVNPVRLTAAGQDFLPRAEKLVDEIYKVRDETQQFTQGRKTITVHTQHSLMVSHVPTLLEGIQSLLEDCFVRFTANNQQDAVQEFLASDSDFLLCFVALGLPQRLNSSHLEEVVINYDRLLPVTPTDTEGKPQYRVEKGLPLRMLSYPRGSFLYRLIEQNSLNSVKKDIPVQIVFENALATGLKLMALKGYGVAWLPESLIIHELHNRQLVLLEGVDFPPITLTIKLYRHQSATSVIAEKFWQSCASKGNRQKNTSYDL